tara:strand:+ start:53 stop:355 length:303 start_codon:yes stop_codon:yes gene_type:complete
MLTSIAIAILSVINSQEKETDKIYIEDVRDITFDAPNFSNAPQFSLGNSLESKKENPRINSAENIRRNEESLSDVLFDLYGDEYDIRTWNGHIIYNRRSR